jgi:hypothetical protein
MALTAEQIRDFLTDANVGNEGWFDYTIIPNNFETEGEIDILDEDGSVEETRFFNYGQIVREIDKYAGKLGMAVDDFMGGYYDASDADTIMQYVILGELTFA